jgi:phasin family protein
VQQLLLHDTDHPPPEQTMLNTESLAAAQQANVKTLVGLASKSIESVEQLATLNIQTARTNLEQAAGAAEAVLAAKDAQALLAVQNGLLQPSAEQVLAYSRQVADILAATKAEFEKAAAEQAAGAQSALLAAVEAATKNAPEGTAGGVEMFKSAVSAANNAFESLQKAARQATDAANANVAALTSAATKAAAVSKAKRG